MGITGDTETEENHVPGTSVVGELNN